MKSLLCFFKGHFKRSDSTTSMDIFNGHNTYLKFSCGALGIAMDEQTCICTLLVLCTIDCTLTVLFYFKKKSSVMK